MAVDYTGIAGLVASLGTAIASVGALYVRKRRDDADEDPEATRIHRELMLERERMELEQLRERHRHQVEHPEHPRHHRADMVWLPVYVWGWDKWLTLRQAGLRRTGSALRSSW